MKDDSEMELPESQKMSAVKKDKKVLLQRKKNAAVADSVKKVLTIGSTSIIPLKSGEVSVDRLPSFREDDSDRDEADASDEDMMDEDDSYAKKASLPPLAFTKEAIKKEPPSKEKEAAAGERKEGEEKSEVKKTEEETEEKQQEPDTTTKTEPPKEKGDSEKKDSEEAKVEEAAANKDKEAEIKKDPETTKAVEEEGGLPGADSSKDEEVHGGSPKPKLEEKKSVAEPSAKKDDGIKSEKEEGNEVKNEKDGNTEEGGRTEAEKEKRSKSNSRSPSPPPTKVAIKQ
jgi:hypothetical protein